MRMQNPFRLFALAAFLAIAGTSSAQTAPAAKAPETTPLTLPGAETFVYRELQPDALRLHVFKPKAWKPADRRPAFVWFFGGGWSHGTPANAAGFAKWAADLGFVGIAPDYRTHDRFGGTSPLASVADSRLALRWIEDHAAELGIDPKRIVVGGNSAGGHVALWTAITHTPPGSDEKEAPTIKPVALVLTSAVSDTTTEKGYTPKRFGENTTALSPIDQLDAKMPPALVYHGDADTTVPQRQSLALRDKLRATGNVCEFINVPGGSHNFSGDLPEWREKTKTLIRDFLAQRDLLPAGAR